VRAAASARRHASSPASWRGGRAGGGARRRGLASARCWSVSCAVRSVGLRSRRARRARPPDGRACVCV